MGMIWTYFYIKSLFAGLAPIFAAYGISAIIVLGCIAWSWFMPVFKRFALWVALTTIAATAFYTLGVHDEAGRWKAKESVTVQVAKKARAEAVKRVNSGKSSWLRHTDKHDRDAK